MADADELLFAPDRARRGTAVRGTAGWDAAMKKAKGQAERYVRSLPAWPPLKVETFMRPM